MLIVRDMEFSPKRPRVIVPLFARNLAALSAQTAAAEASLAFLMARRRPAEEKEGRHPADTAMSRLYEHAAVRGIAPPCYSEREAAASTVQSPLFVADCSYGNKKTVGEGGSKRAARQAAAEKMLECLKKED